MKVEDKLKNLIIKRYGTLKAFCEITDTPYSTLLTLFKRGLQNATVKVVTKICSTLEIDTDELIEGRIVNRQKGGTILDLDPDEATIMLQLRQLPEKIFQSLKILINSLYESYQNSDTKEKPPFISRPLYELPVSAGTGQFLDSNHFELVDFPSNVVPTNSTFAVKVAGDSMEPEYPDQSVVFVKQTKCLNHGDIGIFILNNEAYLKIYGEEGLLSYNPDYDLIPVGEYDDLRIVGKVVGKYEK